MENSGLSQNDIRLVAEALIEMFGDEAPSRATGRAKDYESNSDGETFWLDVSEAISQLLYERRSKP